jgi:hypothetical protein
MMVPPVQDGKRCMHFLQTTAPLTGALQQPSKYLLVLLGQALPQHNPLECLP